MTPSETSPALRQIVGAAVVDSLSRPSLLLVARRTAPEQFAGMWEFPGGKVESGEAVTDALHRELLEELGITVRLGAEVAGPLPAGWPLNAGAAMRVWFAEVADGTAQPLQDHDELRWVSLGDAGALDELPWIPADRPIVDALRVVVGRGRGLGLGPLAPSLPQGGPGKA